MSSEADSLVANVHVLCVCCLPAAGKVKGVVVLKMVDSHSVARLH